MKDKVAVVTGSTGDGIGKASAQEFARHGAYVVVNGRSQQSVDATITDIVHATGASPGHVLGVPGTAGSADGVAKLIQDLEAIESKLGRPVDCLVNNLGIFHVQDFTEISDEKWLQYYEINTLSGVRLSRHFLPRMLERNSSGRILLISSECGFRPLPHMVAYSVSKSSQISLARGLAEITKGSTVTVNSILPGPTMTGGVRDYMKDFNAKHQIDDFDQGVQQYFKEHERTSLLQRFLHPREIADTCMFLCSPLASGINGTAQHVDGGIPHHL